MSVNVKNQKEKIAKFSIHPHNKYNGESPYFRKPCEVGHFSLDGKRGFHDNSSQLRRYMPPPNKSFEFDLRKGYDTYIEKDDDVKERLTHLLMWITQHREVFQLKDQKKDDTRLNTDFIAWRGHFTKFLITPYQTREPWKMAVSKFNGTIYISEVETEKSKQERLNRTPIHQEMCYWGYKFEAYVTKSMKDSVNDDFASAVNSNEAYCSIVRARLEKHSLLLGAEVDCCIPSNPKKPPDNYVELKTSKMMYSYKQKQNFMRFKLLKFWAQSYLSGLPKVVVGLRDDDGVVSALREYQTLHIPHLSEDGNTIPWNSNLCINFLSKLLDWIKSFALIDDPNIVYMMIFDEPFDYVHVEIIDDGSERFLPSWYTDIFSSS